jgi:hypothetical protein
VDAAIHRHRVGAHEALAFLDLEIACLVDLLADVASETISKPPLRKTISSAAMRIPAFFSRTLQAVPTRAFRFW